VDAAGNFATPEGITYRVLWLPDTRRMLPETVEKLLEHVRAGATIIGVPPQGAATLKGGATAAAERIAAASAALWGKTTGTDVRNVGKGRVISGALPLDAALRLAGLAPDVTGTRAAPASTIDDTALWSHRRTAGADWYFVSAPRGQGFRGPLSFRATGAVEIWDPVTGDTRAVLSRRDGARTLVNLDIPKAGAVFVVFKDAAVAATTTVAVSNAELSRDGKTITAWEPGPVSATYSDGTVQQHNATQPRTISLAPWKLSFPAGWDAPETPLTLAALKPWKDLEELSVEARAFSGTATYTTTFDLPDSHSAAPLQLDLGAVEMIAEVSLNGKKLRTLWAPPYRLEIPGAKPGKNVLTVAVTSTWYNRLSYDNKRPVAERKTWTLGGPGRGDRVPSGLLGPVVLRAGEALVLKPASAK
jgi:hypothetical protein